ncbi:MAG TPA: hypothetical protein VKU38_00025 [Ktedonobacteraceae bacterium]|nr:hypothetical protein [Ktedonobacteraceae bacterium]
MAEQQYDSSFKEFIHEQIAEILAPLLEGVVHSKDIVFEQELTVEVLRPTMRADKVFRARYLGQPHIFHLEYQSGSDAEIVYRVLVYNAGILWDYHLPVISVIIYLFRTIVPVPPLQVMSGEDSLINFKYYVLPLWELDAERYVRDHIVSMYPLLPAMQGASAELLSRAIQELADYYKYDESRLARQLVWLGILLRRADTVAPLDKAKVEERLTMYERLWEEDPKIQKYLADKSEERMRQGLRQGLEQGLEQGRTQGEILASQRLVVEYVQLRFPAIAVLAQQKVTQIKRVDELEKLFRLTISAPDEATARWVIDNYAA